MSIPLGSETESCHGNHCNQLPKTGSSHAVLMFWVQSCALTDICPGKSSQVCQKQLQKLCSGNLWVSGWNRQLMVSWEHNEKHTHTMKSANIISSAPMFPKGCEWGLFCSGQRLESRRSKRRRRRTKRRRRRRRRLHFSHYFLGRLPKTCGAQWASLSSRFWRRRRWSPIEADGKHTMSSFQRQTTIHPPLQCAPSPAFSILNLFTASHCPLKL